MKIFLSLINEGKQSFQADILSFLCTILNLAFIKPCIGLFTVDYNLIRKIEPKKGSILKALRLKA